MRKNTPGYAFPAHDPPTAHSGVVGGLPGVTMGLALLVFAFGCRGEPTASIHPAMPGQQSDQDDAGTRPQRTAGEASEDTKHGKQDPPCQDVDSTGSKYCGHKDDDAVGANSKEGSLDWHEDGGAMMLDPWLDAGVESTGDDAGDGGGPVESGPDSSTPAEGDAGEDVPAASCDDDYPALSEVVIAAPLVDPISADGRRIHWSPVCGATRYILERTELSDTPFSITAREVIGLEFIDGRFDPHTDTRYEVRVCDAVECVYSAPQLVPAQPDGR